MADKRFGRLGLAHRSLFGRRRSGRVAVARAACCLTVLLVGLSGARSSRADFDLTGDWYAAVGGNEALLTHFVQSGTSLFDSFGDTGSVDPATGAFTLSVPPYIAANICGALLTAQVDPTGLTFTGTALIGFTPPDCPTPTCACTGVLNTVFVGSRSPCGDGVVDPGETCDGGYLGEGTDCCALGCAAPQRLGELCAGDSNLCTVDLCDTAGACTHPAGNAGTTCRQAAGVCDVAETCDGVSTICPADLKQPDGTDCSDDLFCNGEEGGCQSGICQSGTAPCPEICDETLDACACPPQPRTCRTAQRSVLRVKDIADDARDSLHWSWVKGAGTDPSELGDPSATTPYALCVFAGTASTLVADAIVPADAEKWKPAAAGYTYKDPAATAEGITKVVLKPGLPGKAKARVVGKGPALSTLPLPATAPLTVQLFNGDDPVCWGATYTSGQLLQNEGDRLKAKAP